MATTTDGRSSFSEDVGFIIFTDLDGTLLDHHTYAWGPAAPALNRIRAQGWPLIPVTSKTRAEVEPLREELGLQDPFVVENGGGVFLPDRTPWDGLGSPAPGTGGHRLRRLTLGLPYADIRRFVLDRGRALGVRGFGDMTLQEVMDRTGLDRDAAGRARERDFTEPFVLEKEDALEQLLPVAAEEGLAITRGGRFFHLMGAGQDKGRAVDLLREAWAGSRSGTVRSLALGDGANDVPMLDAADVAVLVPAPDRPLPPVERDDAVVAPQAGPAGWSAAVLALTDTAVQSVHPNR